MQQIKALFRSRKFLLMLAAALQTIALDNLGMSMEVWATIDAIIAVLIASIAYEDGKMKGNTFRYLGKPADNQIAVFNDDSVIFSGKL